MLALLLAAIGPAKADVIWDYSPDTTHASLNNSSYSNDAGGQNFLELVNFATSVTIDGMDIFSGSSFGTVGQQATIKIFGSNGSTPQGMLDYFTTTIDAVDTQGTTSLSSLTRKHADFGGIVLSAGSYWIGMSGTTQELAQAGLNGVQDSKMYQLNGNQLQNFTATGDMAFRLYDAPSTPIPEPFSLALLGVGVLAVSAVAKCRADVRSAL